MVNKKCTKKGVRNKQKQSLLFVYIANRLCTILGVSYSYKVKQDRPKQSTDNPEKVMKILVNILVSGKAHSI